MDKRLLLTLLISVGIIVIWQHFVMPHLAPPPPAAPSPAPQAPSPEAPKAPSGAPSAAMPSPPEAGRPPVKKEPQQLSTVEQPGRYRASFSNWGAAPAEWLLTHPQYKEYVSRDDKKELVPIDLVSKNTGRLPLSISFPQSDFEVPPDAAYTLDEKAAKATSPNELVYAYETGAVRVEKRFTFVPDTYQVHLKITIENRGDKPLSHHLELGMAGWQDPNVKAGGMFGRQEIQTEGLCDINGKLKHKNLEGLIKEPIEELGTVRFIGYDHKYFIAAVAPAPSSDTLRCRVTGAGDGKILSSLLYPERKVAAQGKAEYELAGFLGPKLLADLDAVKVAGADAHLGDSMDYGMTEILARPMLAVLKSIHRVVPNWGLAVIVLTILLKALTWLPTQQSMKSMKAMAKLKPEMDKIKERYGSDKQRMNVEVMNLYKKHGVNPIGGCLPILIQMPIYIALYSMLGRSVELYRSAFVGWIHDLTAPDPYFVLPLLTGALMFLQQKTAPTPPDPQQKSMMYMMPIMFTGFSMFLPAGLTVYILTNTVLTMVQQWWMNRGAEPAVARS